MKKHTLRLLVAFGISVMTASALAQTVPLHFSTTNSVVDEFDHVLTGTGPGAPTFGFPYITGEVVQILQGDSGALPPAVDGTPDSNNTILAELTVGDGVDPSLGPVGMFGGSLANRPSGQVFARVFNKASLTDASFYADSQLFTVPTTNYDIFFAEVQKTLSPMDPSDADNDGLHNSWEKSLTSNPNNPDSDGDGMADGAEFRAGTDVLDQASLLMMVELRPQSGGNLDICWDSVLGKQYVIEYTADDLRNNPVYTDVTGILTATGSVCSTTISGGLLQQGGHYRVRLSE
jgi:hypothetical protein